MRRPEQQKASSPRAWVSKAREDLAAAETLLREGPRHAAAVGFHAQQAVEKMLKAVLVARGVAFPKTHDLAHLLDLLATVEPSLAGSFGEVEKLTSFAAALRYPGIAARGPRVRPQTALKLAQHCSERVLAVLCGKPARKG